jgi:hypothetical protein
MTPREKVALIVGIVIGLLAAPFLPLRAQVVAKTDNIRVGTEVDMLLMSLPDTAIAGFCVTRGYSTPDVGEILVAEVERAPVPHLPDCAGDMPVLLVRPVCALSRDEREAWLDTRMKAWVLVVCGRRAGKVFRPAPRAV